MAYHPPVTLDEIKRRLKREQGDLVTLDESTYINVTTKARFIDKDYGEWWALPNLVTRKNHARCHPKRGFKKIAESKFYHIDDVLKNLKQKHLNDVTLDITTYVNMNKKARFIHSQFGEWWATPNSVITKETSHPMMGAQKISDAKRFSINIIKQRLNLVHKGRVSVDETTYHDMRTKARFIDIEFGEWMGIPHKVLSGTRHPKLRHLKKICRESIQHWKSGELITWTGTYEKAFVNWCNSNKYDFDWQVEFTTDLLTPKGKHSKYYIDAFVIDGPLAQTYVEIKGWWRDHNGTNMSRLKWEWFHTKFPNSKLLMKKELNELGIKV